jgi:hypothetical protein
MNYKADKIHHIEHTERRRLAFLFSNLLVFLLCSIAYSQSVVSTVAVVSPPLPPSFDLTGSWTADDGGIYYVRQLGNTIWWAGLSTDSPQGVNDFQRGLRFTNIFRGTIEGNSINGTWTDVPRGQSLKSGTLTLRIAERTVPLVHLVHKVLEKQTETGGFSGTIWNPLIPQNPPRCDNITAGSPDIRCKFNRVKKNDDSTLYDNLKPEKDNVVVFGTVTGRLTPAYPANAGRSYQDFLRTWGDGEGDFDGDLHFNMRIDRAKLDAQPNFWNRNDEWLYGSINGLQAKLNHSGNSIHSEVIMYGRTEGGRQTLLPGWMEKSSNSVLWNGFPIGSVAIDPTTIVRIGGARLSEGTRVRITGVLALDCGHGITHDCADDDAEPNNLEIHPVYSIDVLQNFQLPRLNANLTGVWAATDVGTYYVSQVGNTVWWLGLSRDRGLTFANVFRGTIQQRTAGGELIIAGEWADIPLGVVRGGGTISLRSDPGVNRESPTALNKVSFTGGFGAQKWEKLYEPHSDLVGPTTGTVEIPERGCKGEKTNLANLQRSLKENQDEIRRLGSDYSKAPAQQKQRIQLEIKEAQATERELLQQITKAEQLLKQCLSRPQ